MPRLIIDVLVSLRRTRPPRATPELDRDHDQRMDWRPLPHERRNRERRGTGGFARFVGPGGEAEHTMTASEARAIANALGIPFEAAHDETISQLRKAD